ncbi:MAG: GNAT family N-acetyltransferase [Candidatus Poribacteria bacterium]|nr:GNAT family N-acetyltransferase [Candidatus Poribacteria bacterium]
MNHLTVEKLNAGTTQAALSLINDTYADAHGFTPLTEGDLGALDKTGFFVIGSINKKPISFAYGSVVEADRGLIRWAAVSENFRGKCYSLFPMQACITQLKDNGAKQIYVENWVDAPYRRLLSHFESSATQLEHDQLIMRLDMGQHTPEPPTIAKGYVVRAFREGDEATWANVKNAVFGSSSQPQEFWKQDFNGVNMESDFDREGFFFAEKDGQPAGICAGIVLHDRKKIGDTFPGSIGWTGVLEEHRGIGLGRALMIHSLNYLHGKGIAATELGTQFYRTAAVNLYEHLGFRIHIASFKLI